MVSNKRLHNFFYLFIYLLSSSFRNLNTLSANPKNGQTHSNNLSATADEFLEYV